MCLTTMSTNEQKYEVNCVCVSGYREDNLILFSIKINTTINTTLNSEAKKKD